MTDYVKSLKINSVSHPVLGKALENCNTSAGAVKDLKVWQGTAEEFQNQTCNLYAWTDNRDSAQSFGATMGLQSSAMCDCGDFTMNAQYRISKDLQVTETNLPTNVSPLVHVWTGTKAFAYAASKIYTSVDDGFTWTAQDTTLESIRSFVYFNNKIIATTNSAVYYSTDDCATWTEIQTGYTLSGIQIFKGPDCVFLVSNSALYVSFDGLAWSQANDVVFIDCKVNGVYYGHKRYNSAIFTSTDALTWTQHSTYVFPNAAVSVLSLTTPGLGYSNGKWVCAGRSDIQVSTDLVTWTSKITVGSNFARTSLFNALGHTALFASDKFVAVYDSTTVSYTTSSEPQVGDLVFETGRVISTTVSEVGASTIKTGHIVHTRDSSKDGEKPVPASFKDPTMLCNVKDTAIIVGTDIAMKRPLRSDEVSSLTSTGSLYGISPQNTLVFSTETVSKKLTLNDEYHKTCSYSVPMTGIEKLLGMDNYVVALSPSGVYTGTSGYTWVLKNITKEDEGRFCDMAIDNHGKILVVTLSLAYPKVRTNAYYSADNGSTWTSFQKPFSGDPIVAYGNDKFVMVDTDSNGGNRIYYSTNGTTWTAATFSNITFFSAISYCNDRFVLLPVDRGAYYSTDGITWTQASVPSYDYKSATYTNGLYILSTGSKVYTSTDFTNWTDYSIECDGVAYGNGIYMTYGYFKKWGYDLSTLNAVENLSESTYGILFANNTFMLQGGNGIFMVPKSTVLVPAQNGYNPNATQTFKSSNGAQMWVTDAA